MREIENIIVHSKSGLICFFLAETAKRISFFAFVEIKATEKVDFE